MYTTITLTSAVSSSPGASAVVDLNWIGAKPVSVSVLPATAGTSAVFQIQYSLDDPMRVASSLMAWSGVSSATGQPATTFSASAAGLDGVLVSFLNPIAAIRINSSNLAGGPLTMKVLQGEGG